MEKTSQFIQNDFPLFHQVNGPQMVAFIQAYYEWLEQKGNVRDYGNNLTAYRDIDDTLPEFISHFQYEYLNQLPTNLLASKPLLIKHILDLYRSKGTRRGIALLFRLLFNEDVELYLPGNDIFKTSSSQWVQPSYVELSDCPFLEKLVGNSVYSLNGHASALVESVNIVRSSNKVINMMFLSRVVGTFRYGDRIMSSDVAYDVDAAPYIVGSLSSVSIENGGALYNIGDIVSIKGSGCGALGRVSSTREENGKVFFDLKDGGFGFTMDADIQVIGGGGTGATFKVGSLTNQVSYRLNTDIINDYYDTTLDDASQGFTINYANQHGGVFLVSEVINCVGSNTVNLDFSYISGDDLHQFEILSNTSLGISVECITIDNPSFVKVSGTDANLNKLAGGQVLSAATSDCIIYINSVMPKEINFANGVISAATSSAITIHGGNVGHPIPTSIITGLTSGATANTQSITRNTDWQFQSYPTNLDTSIDLALTWYNIVIGTISSLSNENPGEGYSSNPTVIITEPKMIDLNIGDGLGGIWGSDANVSANAVFANGIVTSVQIIDSGFGFTKGETIVMSSPKNEESIQAIAITDATGIGQGYWKGKSAGVSDTSHLIDSYYYQDYSYELVAARALESYEILVESLMGPIGYVMFGKYAVKDTQMNTSEVLYDSMTQSP